MAPKPSPEICAESNIAILDDDPSSVNTLERILRHVGYETCRGFSDPYEALTRFRNTPPDILLLDWHMEPLSGGDVLRQLQQTLSADDMPLVVVLTADDAHETRREALNLGAVDFLTKPLDQTEVLLRIRNLLQLRRLNRRFQTENRNLDEQVACRTAQLEKSLADIAELQQHIIEQERLRALGSMAAGIAHDFNNVLTIIRGYSDMLIEHESIRSDPAKLGEYLGIIGTAAGDASEVVRRLQTFSRPYAPDEEGRQELDLNKVVTEAVQLSLPRWQTQTQAHGIFIDMQVQLGRVPPVVGYPVELRELLINLIFNAVDAMPQGGPILVRTGESEGKAFFEVRDSGTGMTEETRRRCLEPFYTTKGNRGTGLGLSTTYGIINRHGGILRFTTELNRGTQFTVQLPAAERFGSISSTEPAPPCSPPLSVLVVDDQPDICHVLQSYLQSDHHTVATAENGCAALEMFRGGHFDLVITDRAMPKMNGDQLASAIKEIQPNEPIILMTAFSEFRRLSPDVDFLIEKPFSLRKIREAITKVMAA